MRITRTTLCAAALALVAGACGDDGTNTTPTTDTLFNADASFPDTLQNDTATPIDTVQPPTDTVQPVDTMTMPDLVPDLDPPYIASTTPADGASNIALPLTVSIVFSEPVYAPTIAPQTIKLYDFAGVEVPGTPTLGTDGKTVTWVPTQNTQQLASPYTIKVLGNIITDLAGNKFVNDETFTFTTANYPDQDGYRAVAAAYAPTITSAVQNGEVPYAQVPTKIDSDGDWNLANNKDWLTMTATTIIPAVYYNVAETRTHYFIHYLLYFPWVNDTAADYAHGNGSLGYLVTVEKARGDQVERPISVHSYWKANQSEENQAFVTTESGIIGSGLSASQWSVYAEFSQDTLFPDGHFHAYVTAKTHRACLWGWNQSGTGAQCAWPAEVQTGKKLVFAYAGGSPTPYQKKDNVWPNDMSAITGTPESLGYALIPALTSMWPRRFQTGPTELFQGDTFTYAADAGRTVAAGLELTAKFLDPVGASPTAYGRPMWAWHWNPGTGSTADGAAFRVVRGEMGLDPAWYVWERHSSTVNSNSLVAYDEATGAGFSTDYCFNGFANIDVRTTDAKCQ